MNYDKKDLERLQRALNRRNFLTRIGSSPAFRLAQNVAKDSISPSSMYSMDRARKDMETMRDNHVENSPPPVGSNTLGPGSQMKIKKAAPVFPSAGDMRDRPPLRERPDRPFRGKQPKTDYKVTHEEHPGRGALLDVEKGSEPFRRPRPVRRPQPQPYLPAPNPAAGKYVEPPPKGGNVDRRA